MTDKKGERGGDAYRDYFIYVFIYKKKFYFLFLIEKLFFKAR